MVSKRQKVITLGGDPARLIDSESKKMIPNFKRLCIQDNVVIFYLEHNAHLSCQTSGRDRRFIARAGQVLSAAMNAEEELSHFTISTRRRGAERRERAESLIY